MISLESWKIRQSSDVDFSFPETVYEKCYVGTELSLDDRVEWIDGYLNSASEFKITTSYDNNNAELSFSSELAPIKIGTISHIPTPKGKILFDATSLLLPELIYLMEWACLTKKNFDVIYVEPSAYTGTTYKTKIGFQSIDYSLSEDGPGLCMLPRFTSPIDEGYLIVALGYEGHRFGALLNSDEITPRHITGLLGVPPFVLGWEKNTYAKNHREMSEACKKYETDFKVVAANDPLQNYNALCTLEKSISAVNPKNMRRMHVAPIGTKPVALAMAWFAVNNKGTGVLYDFIRKKSKRSIGVGKVHFWKFSCN